MTECLVVVLTSVKVDELSEFEAMEAKLDQVGLRIQELLLVGVDERDHRVLVGFLQQCTDLSKELYFFIERESLLDSPCVALNQLILQGNELLNRLINVLGHVVVVIKNRLGGEDDTLLGQYTYLHLIQNRYVIECQTTTNLANTVPIPPKLLTESL